MSVKGNHHSKQVALITGGQGFLGKEITRSFLRKGWEVHSLGKSSCNDIICDLSCNAPLLQEACDIVVHCAAKAHSVPKTEAERKEFEAVNVAGTFNLLKGLEAGSVLPKAFVFISSIAVYGLDEGDNVNENHPLSAKDPYGLSKIRGEGIVSEWAIKHGIALTILRLPLLAGQNPPGNLGAMIRGIRKGFYFRIAKGESRKSLVMASDVAEIVPGLIDKSGIYNLTDGFHPSFRELEILICSQLKVNFPLSIPPLAARILGFLGDVVGLIAPGGSPLTSRTVRKILSSLTFDDQKAREQLGWKPNRVTDVFRIE